ncbi:MAG: heme-binding protein [Acidobacteriaceae bacterium]|nr:heme-binding protein [Acidobacteriaceae bacterium]
MSAIQKSVQLVDARRMVDAARKKAEELKQSVSIAVVCAGGHLLVFERMEGAWLASVELAVDKAWTARAFDVATKDLAKKAQPGGEFYGVTGGRTTLLTGGVPVLQDNAVVGAIGVSGCAAAQEQEIAEAGAQAF